jgi:hypothetical protein
MLSKNMQRQLPFQINKQKQWPWRSLFIGYDNSAHLYKFIHGTEFVNKLNKELFKLLDIKHSTTTPGHPQCNAQAEVFNKTMAKYLVSFGDGSTLDWEQYLPALQFSYNTSYHSAIATTPFELLYVNETKDTFNSGT